MARLFDDQGEHNWAIYSRITAVAFIILYFVAMAGFLQVPGLVNYAGLLQRISVVICLTWMTLLPLHLLNSRQKFEAIRRK
jgi:succinate dehydrogenase hydrophobic anchor subunit